MASATPIHFGFVRLEESSSPEQSVSGLELSPTRIEAPASVEPKDAKDPEGFLKRCSGYNKKTKLRCGASIGKRSQQNTQATYLPTCSNHRDQQSFAGWCQHQHAGGKRCGRLFRWVRPYFELCGDHQGLPDSPCYFLKLPLELRHEIFRYLLPTKPIGSSTAALHDGLDDEFDAAHVPNGLMTARTRALIINPHHVAPPGPGSVFPTPLVDLLLVNRQICHEVKDLLYSIATFTIDVRKDGTFMCGRRLLEPRRADGSSHFLADEADEAKERFLRTFDWAAVKNYSVDILLENWSCPPHQTQASTWDEEVEIYDIRDYVSVVVSGILAKSHHLCKLQVRLCLADFKWQEEQIMTNAKLIVSPFERLRNVRQPHLAGVFFGRPYHNSMLSVQRPPHSTTKGPLNPPPICSVPPFLTHLPVMLPGMAAFDAYTADWARCMSASSSAPVCKKPPIREMFTEFKDFYSKLSNIVPDITYRNGRHTFLHRARVAREQENVAQFRHLRNELIQFWYAYVEQEERKKTDMNSRLSKMLDTDTYPSHEWEESSNPTRRNSSAAQSPVVLNALTMAKEGIPMTGNHIAPSEHNFGEMQLRQYREWHRLMRHQRQGVPAGVQYQQSQDLARAHHQEAQYYAQQQSQLHAQNIAALRELSTRRAENANNGVTSITSSTSDLYAPPSSSLLRSSADTALTYQTVNSQLLPGFNPNASSEPGPSLTKKQKIDSGIEEAAYGGMIAHTDVPMGVAVDVNVNGVETLLQGNSSSMPPPITPYVGKGKGKMEM
ncbi:uncharacterized protein K460DRAFT_358101 [Cucurbitaria berberidis CBS 394.84]|uniref:F-box domain-containing protein n=1 Tax=Cucurbitaria berberidis CBS 394.84 TaxID=1168544 RepID=A0A9P4G951_9PLEO|nr:uncharacterized protein K460DRAFT_358101 [Cucurbitaria berberidis CBS 394.84]KAF1841321.1 hypothetical protein K460DRAFT_358101 [Cucurbitaria berberidis CBS 394.84]